METKLWAYLSVAILGYLRWEDPPCVSASFQGQGFWTELNNIEQAKPKSQLSLLLLQVQCELLPQAPDILGPPLGWTTGAVSHNKLSFP